MRKNLPSNSYMDLALDANSQTAPFMPKLDNAIMPWPINDTIYGGMGSTCHSDVFGLM